jgi:hypothetical protein
LTPSLRLSWDRAPRLQATLAAAALNEREQRVIERILAALRAELRLTLRRARLAISSSAKLLPTVELHVRMLLDLPHSKQQRC